MITDSDYDREFERFFEEILKQNGLDLNSLTDDQRANVEMLAHEAVEANHYEAEWLDYLDKRNREINEKRG